MLVTNGFEMAPMPRCVYEGQRMVRLDDILNSLKIGMSRICHTDYPQTIIDGKLSIQPCPIQDDEFDIAETMFGLSINVWTFKLVQKNEEWTQIRMGNPKNKIVINLHRRVDK